MALEQSVLNDIAHVDTTLSFYFLLFLENKMYLHEPQKKGKMNNILKYFMVCIREIQKTKL